MKILIYNSFAKLLANKINIIVKKIINIINSFILLPVIILITLLRPIILIRFGVIDATRIGHLCNTEGYLCLKSIEKKHKYSIDIIGCTTKIANKQLYEMYSRVIKIYPFTTLLLSLEKVLKFWSINNIHIIDFKPSNLQYTKNFKNNIKFSDIENEEGNKILKRLGIPLNTPWVCIHNRDNAYLDEAHAGHDWTYHSYRDFDISTMELCAEELARRGYYVLRMGSSTEKR